jgi:hypothetical protein
MQLIAKAFLWVHITLYRLTNGRIGGKFIARSRSCCSPPPGGRPASSGPDRSPMSATKTASCYAPPTAAPLTIPPGTTTCAPPAEPSKRPAAKSRSWC